jgi:hypothetical protein
MTQSAIDAAMHNILTQPNPTLEESVFVKKWLPLLAANTSSIKAPVGMWVSEVSGSPFQAIDIVNGKTVLFTVPPMLDSNSIVIQDQALRKNLTIPGMIAEAGMRSANIPKQGENFLNHHLATLIVGGELHPENLVIWQNILARYNIRPMDLPESLGGAKASTGEMEFDDVEDL